MPTVDDLKVIQADFNVLVEKRADWESGAADLKARIDVLVAGHSADVDGDKLTRLNEQHIADLKEMSRQLGLDASPSADASA